MNRWNAENMKSHHGKKLKPGENKQQKSPEKGFFWKSLF
jgi:hypothetical protein